MSGLLKQTLTVGVQQTLNDACLSPAEFQCCLRAQHSNQKMNKKHDDASGSSGQHNNQLRDERRVHLVQVPDSYSAIATSSCNKLRSRALRT